MQPRMNTDFYEVARSHRDDSEGDLEIQGAWDNSRCMILTSSGSVFAHVFKHFALQYGPAERRKTYWELTIAFAFRDECDREKGPESHTIGTVLKHAFWDAPQNANVSLNPMSGTLLVGGMSDFAYYFERMARFSEKQWKHDPVMKKWLQGEAVSEGVKWEKLLKTHKATDEDRAKHVAMMKPLLERLAIRFDVDTDFLGEGSVVKKPPNSYYEFGVPHPDDWDTKLATLKDDIDREYREKEVKRKARYVKRKGSLNGYVPGSSNNAHTHYRARVFATLPGLIDVHPTDASGEQDQYTLTQAEYQAKIKTEEWQPDSEDRED